MHVGFGEILHKVSGAAGLSKKNRHPFFFYPPFCASFVQILVSNPSISVLGIKRESGAIPELSPQL
jgi:hypothetical protein